MSTLAAAAFALGACGSDSSSEDFAAEGNRICRQTQREFTRIQRVAPRSAEQAAGQAEALADVSRQALDELRELEPPEEAQDAYERYLDAREVALGHVEDGAEAAADKDPQAYAEAKRKAAAGQATRLGLAREVGLAACSRPGVTLER